jgi:hypothetical protein
MEPKDFGSQELLYMFAFAAVIAAREHAADEAADDNAATPQSEEQPATSSQ